MNDFNLEVKDSKNRQYSITVKTLPDTCPCCHKGIEPTYRFGFIHDNGDPLFNTDLVQAIFQCPRRECQRIFVADYTKFNQPRPLGEDERFKLKGLSPYWFEKKEFSQPIRKLSPSFCEIFNEASAVEASKLDNITGPGYRKALEFLIKDYLISIDPTNEVSIKTATLQSLIQNRITDVNLKTCAERAIWLGNDETHYLIKWESQDIDDLKLLITLTVNWVEILSSRQIIKKKCPNQANHDW